MLWEGQSHVGKSVPDMLERVGEGHWVRIS